MVCWEIGLDKGVGAVDFGGGGGGGGGAADPPKFHEPVKTPTDSEAKNVNSPVEKSRPPKGQPGHCQS